VGGSAADARAIDGGRAKFLVGYNDFFLPCHDHGVDLCLNPGLTHRPRPAGHCSRARGSSSSVRARTGGRGTGTSTRRACSWRAWRPRRPRRAPGGSAAARRRRTTARTAPSTAWAPARPCTGCTRSTCRGSSAGSTPAAPSPPPQPPPRRRPAPPTTPRYAEPRKDARKLWQQVRSIGARARHGTSTARTCRGVGGCRLRRQAAWWIRPRRASKNTAPVRKARAADDAGLMAEEPGCLEQRRARGRGRVFVLVLARSFTHACDSGVWNKREDGDAYL
jgi:hypothetical protein